VEFFADSRLVYSWDAGVVTYPHEYVWHGENLSPGPHLCRATVGGIVAESSFEVRTS
jgi:hypothetical protein